MAKSKRKITITVEASKPRNPVAMSLGQRKKKTVFRSKKKYSRKGKMKWTY